MKGSSFECLPSSFLSWAHRDAGHRTGLGILSRCVSTGNSQNGDSKALNNAFLQSPVTSGCKESLQPSHGISLASAP